MKSSLVAAGLVSLVCLTATTACSGSQPTTSPTAGASAPPASVPSPADPTPVADPSTPALGTDDLKGLLISSKDLGKSWGASAGGTGAAPWSPIQCPQPERSTTKVDATGRYWQGYFSNKAARTGGGIVIDLTALPAADGSAIKTAYQADLTTCKTFANQGYYSVDTSEEVAVEGADEVIGSYTRRIYTDKAHKQPVMVFKDLIAREGSVVVEISAGYPSALNSPVVKNFDTVRAQMSKQIAKISKASAS